MNGTEWISVNEKLPQEGKIVRIKIGNLIKNDILFKEGRFWRLRLAAGEGHVYEPDAWAPIERKAKEIREESSASR